jgi:hypothetical protein
MTMLIKVTFKSTSGDETTGFAPLHRNGAVVLPKRMLQLVEAAVAAGDGYVIHAHRGGFSYPLLHQDGASYQLDNEHATSDKWTTQLADAFLKPSKDQLLAYGRYYHTMSAACAVGFVGYVAGRPGWSSTSVINAVCLIIGAAVLFAIGAIYSKGEK